MHTPERPTATIPEVFALAGAVQPRYRALVLLAAFCGLRWGELMGLRRQDIDTDAGTVRVRGAVSELNSGKRTVAVPRSVLPAVVLHLDLYAEQGAHGRVFVGPKGATQRRNHFGGLWRKACAETGGQRAALP
jgi:integrase